MPLSLMVLLFACGAPEVVPRAPGARAHFPPEEILETGIGIYLRGLGLLPPDA